MSIRLPSKYSGFTPKISVAVSFNQRGFLSWKVAVTAEIRAGHSVKTVECSGLNGMLSKVEEKVWNTCCKEYKSRESVYSIVVHYLLGMI